MTKIPVIHKKNSKTLISVNYVIEKLPVLLCFYFYSQNCFFFQETIVTRPSGRSIPSFLPVHVLSLSVGVGVPGCQPSACHTLSLLDGSVRSKMKMKRMRDGGELQGRVVVGLVSHSRGSPGHGSCPAGRHTGGSVGRTGTSGPSYGASSRVGHGSSTDITGLEGRGRLL